MAARLTDKRKKKIIADYLETESYNATAKKNGVCGQTVRRVIEESQNITEKFKVKKEQNDADILAYMESKRNRVCDILETGLRVLPDKIENAKTASEVTTAMGTLIDKWTALTANGRALQSAEDDPITKSLKEYIDNAEP